MNTIEALRNKYIIGPNDISPIVLSLKIKEGRTRKVRRESIANFFGEIGFKYGAEIGVHKGEFSRVMLNSIGNDGRMLFIDPWLRHDNISASRNELIYQNTTKMLKEEFGDRAIIKRTTSVEAAKDVDDGSLDFVYIDARHDFNSVVEDIITWVPKVRRDGIVFGHDYYNGPGFGVIEAINAYTKCNRINTLYLTRDDVPSWFFIKE